MPTFCDHFFQRPPERVAPELLGWTLRHENVAVSIVETEAYQGVDDPASHASGRKTPRNASMFGPPGHAYIYRSYGVHLCFNVVCHRPGEPGAVLVRAGAVLEGEPIVRQRRGRVQDLANGPGRLGQALALDLAFDGRCLLDGPLRLSPPAIPVDSASVACGPRIGISRAVDRPWRFWLADSSEVSRRSRSVS